MIVAEFIMWNRAGGAESKMEESMALEFTICEVRWERKDLNNGIGSWLLSACP